MNKGNITKLKEPIQGRDFQGKYKTLKNGIITASLLNRLEVSRPEKEWVLVTKGGENE